MKLKWKADKIHRCKNDYLIWLGKEYGIFIHQQNEKIVFGTYESFDSDDLSDALFTVVESSVYSSVQKASDTMASLELTLSMSPFLSFMLLSFANRLVEKSSPILDLE